MTAELSIAQLQARNPDALRLAQLCGFAVRLEPLLLRTLRRKFMPGSDPSAEIDLWHSRLVQSRGATAALFSVEVLARVRLSLSQDARSKEVLDITRDCFRDHPPLHRLEIELNALPVIDPNVDDAEIERRFEPLIAQLRQGGDAAQRISRWLLQAAPRWHERVRGTGSAWAALIAASAVLNGRRLVEGAPPKQVSGARLAQALPAALSGTRKVGLARSANALRFVEAGAAEVPTIDVPNYSPLLVLVEIGDASPLVVEVKANVEVAVPGGQPIVLRSLLGDSWRIEYVPFSSERPDTINASGEVSQSSSDASTRKVVILIGGGRQDRFNAIAEGLARANYQPVMPDHFMGKADALPAIRQLLRDTRFVVIDAALPGDWLDVWFAALSEREQLPFVPVLKHGEELHLSWERFARLDTMAGPPVVFETANDLALSLFKLIIEPAEKLRARLPALGRSPAKGLHVFVSSEKFDDMYREEVRQTVLSQRHLAPSVYFSEGSTSGKASDVEQVRACDLFVCLLGYFYGLAPPLEPGPSQSRAALELEYDLARQLRKPIVAFLIQEETFPAETLHQEADDPFYKRLEKEVLVSRIRRSAEIGPLLIRAIAEIERERSGGERPRPAPPTEGSIETASPVDSLTLPDAPDVNAERQGILYTHEQQVVVVGGLLLEFSKEVPWELRSPIADAMLFAQLAANKATESSPDIFEWQRRFFSTLTSIGWRVDDSTEHNLSSSGRNRDLYESMIPPLASLLGPEQASTSKMIDLLRKLGEARDDTPWVTLYNTSSQRQSGGTLELCHVGADRNGGIWLRILSCVIQANESITQVLFFKASRVKAEIRVTSTEIGTSAEQLLATKDAIAERVRPFIRDYMQAVEGVPTSSPAA